ncbi:MAG TPA: acyloxyacyl hydrolase [Stellaceae bacterium]|nr:acyloxyacyl hydrolase [Stellaceae bacterium]
MKTVAKHMLALVALVAVALVAPPVSAQQLSFGGVSLGSPGGPPRLALGAGAFDITPGGQRFAGTQGVFRGEYHFGDVLIPLFSPFVGVDVTTKGGSYVYGGFGFDVNFGPNWVLTPNGALGFYQRGDGTKLGSWMEFRSGAELDYKFADQSRLGLSVQHTSNAGLTKYNPGEQEILLVYQLPLPW